MEGIFNVPIRRSRWSSFWIALAVLVISLLLAAAFSGALLLLVRTISGTVVVIVFGVLWWCMFFLSFPLQRRLARSLDLRKPGMRLTNSVLTMPVTNDLTLQFKLDEPHELRFGWSEFVVATAASPTMHTRTFVTFAMLSQRGQQVFLKAEDSVREAKASGWPKSESVETTAPVVRLWAKDLVALVETMRAGAQAGALTLSDNPPVK
jgi:hypothetical protein